MLNAEEAVQLYNKSQKMLDSMDVVNSIEEMLGRRISSEASNGGRETKIIKGYEHLDDLFFNPNNGSSRPFADKDIVQEKVVGDLKSAGYEVQWMDGRYENKSELTIRW